MNHGSFLLLMMSLALNFQDMNINIHWKPKSMVLSQQQGSRARNKHVK